ncbi:Iq-domain 32-like [Thalictrum thalictroides]|uniref:Iq-domain 32-like n=1 Tax=Thalictrum thalictroides TaxID=46969 RepID=A0A7J6UT35_THATH|nr:Iq-domain 32-like [Thalictrum thalictroides]
MTGSKKSSSSCFKIITCSSGEDSIDNDDPEQSIEEKGSTDKRGWSFRKRSTRHRVLSNTVISETPSSINKESPELTGINFHAQNAPTVSEKISVSQWMDNIPPLANSANSKVANQLIPKQSEGNIDPFISTETAENIGSLTTTEDTTKISYNLDEASSIVIQAAIRGYLAQRALLKLKNIVKLQAAFRGHLERRQAVGTLRCVQAIVKMQALVRSRRTRISLQGSATEEKADEKHKKSTQSPIPLEEEKGRLKSNLRYSSTEKFLTNGFARQLLESAPKKKRIPIKCDPSKLDSAWKWLERWVSVSSPDSGQAQNPESSPGHQEGEKAGSVYEVETQIPSGVACDSVDLSQNATKASSSLQYEDHLITYDTNNFKFQACGPSSSLARDVTHTPQLDDVDLNIVPNTSSTIGAGPVEMQSEAMSQTLPVSNPSKPEAGSEQPRRSMKRMASEQPETEGKKFIYGSRKVCNPAFAAVQSKFEELTSATSGRSNNSSQVVGGETKLDSVSSTADSMTSKKEPSPADNLISREPQLHVGGSDCGTELSISSTLDSPDRSELGGVELEHETETVEKTSYEPHQTTDNGTLLQQVDVEASVTDSSYTFSQKEKLEDIKGESIETATPVNCQPLDPLPERGVSDVQIQMETPTVQQEYRSSPEGSPRSHVTVQESFGTPSSQVSVKPKRNEVDKRGSSKSQKSLSAGKRSPSYVNNDSGARSSTEQLPRDSKNGKRRNSFGSTRPEHVDQDPRETSSNSLPSYMQATESARAKALANSSPRSSPDVQDKDLYVKKRHSLPGANGKQVSPRMQRSLSQAQQGAKGNGALSQGNNFYLFLGSN